MHMIDVFLAETTASVERSGGGEIFLQQLVWISILKSSWTEVS